jgi:hypothetical protein
MLKSKLINRIKCLIFGHVKHNPSCEVVVNDMHTRLVGVNNAMRMRLFICPRCYGVSVSNFLKNRVIRNVS